MIIMKVNYRYYEPDKGLEEIQAKIYNNEWKKSPKSAFQEVTAEGIKQRFLAEKKDPKLARYALKEDGTPLAYIQATIADNTDPPQSWIGYPWAMDDCPVEIQEKLFSEMLEFVRDKYPDNEIVMGFFTNTWQRQVSFAESKGFTLKDTAYFYKIHTTKVSKDTDQEFEVKIGDLDDVDALIELCKSDPNLKEAFPDDESWISYFKDRVLPEGHTIIVLKDGQLVCAGAPLKGFSKDGIIVRFTAIRPGFQKAWKTLLREIALHCNEQGWEEPLLFNSFRDKELAGEMAEEFRAEIRDTQVLFGLKD
ncbi:MAG: hypothetical protein ACFFD4_21095 [Candidatus Odinarchaeota archaeon]